MKLLRNRCMEFPGVFKSFLIILILSAAVPVPAHPEPRIMLAEENIRALRDVMYNQALPDSRIYGLYEGIVKNIETQNLSMEKKNYYLALAEYYMGRAYQSFDDVKTVISHNRDMRAGKYLTLINYYTYAESAAKHYEKGLALLERMTSFSVNCPMTSDVFRLYGEMLGQLVLLKEPGFVLSHGLDINRYIRKALETDGNNIKASILLGAGKIYPPPLYGGNPKKGILMLTALLSEQNLDREDYYNIYSTVGYANFLIGDLDQAEQWLIKALDLYPGNMFARGILLLTEEE